MFIFLPIFALPFHHVLLRPSLTQIPLTPLSQSWETRDWVGSSQEVVGGVLVEVSAWGKGRKGALCWCRMEGRELENRWGIKNEENFTCRIISLMEGEGRTPCFVPGCLLLQTVPLEQSSVCLPPAGAYVALTLLGSSPSSVGVCGPQQDPAPAGAPRVTPVIPPPPPPPPLPPPQRITGPRPLQVTVLLLLSSFWCPFEELPIRMEAG